MISADTFMIWMNAQIWHPSLMSSSSLGSLLPETLDRGRGMHEARQVASVRLLDGHTTNWKHLDSHHSKLLVSWSVDNFFWEALHLRTAFQVNLTGIWPISHHIQNYEPLFSLCLHPQKIGIRPYMALKYETKITKKKEQRFVVQLCILWDYVHCEPVAMIVHDIQKNTKTCAIMWSKLIIIIHIYILLCVSKTKTQWGKVVSR